MDTFLIFEDKSHSWDNTKILDHKSLLFIGTWIVNRIFNATIQEYYHTCKYIMPYDLCLRRKALYGDADVNIINVNIIGSPGG